MTGFCDFGPLMDFTVSRVLWVNKTLNFERFKFYKTITTFSVGVFKASQEISSKYILGKWKLGPVIAEIRFLDFYLSKSVLKFFYSLERITLKLQRQKFILSLLTREGGGEARGERLWLRLKAPVSCAQSYIHLHSPVIYADMWAGWLCLGVTQDSLFTYHLVKYPLYGRSDSWKVWELPPNMQP